MRTGTFCGGKMGVKTLAGYLQGSDSSPTECDGCSRLVSHDLTLLGVDHRIYQGYVEINAGDGLKYAVTPHFWVNVWDDARNLYIVDFRLRCYAPQDWQEELVEQIPHGLFLYTDFEESFEFHRPLTLYYEEVEPILSGVLPLSWITALKTDFTKLPEVQEFIQRHLQKSIDE